MSIIFGCLYVGYIYYFMYVLDGCNRQLCVTDGCLFKIDGVRYGFMCVIEGCICVRDGCMCIIDGCMFKRWLYVYN